MESETLKNLSILILLLLAPLALSIFSIKSPPKWKDKGPLAPYWSKINIMSLAASGVMATLTFILYNSYLIEYRALATLSVALLTFIFGQTLFTDFTQRLADRRILFSANVISGIAGFWFLNNFDEVNITLYLIFSIIAASIMFAPRVGDSDGRAALLIVLSTYPVIGVAGLEMGIVGFLIAILLYAGVMSYREKNFKAGFFSKLSVPAVPIMLLPFLVIVIIAGPLQIR